MQEQVEHGNCRNCGCKLQGDFCHNCGQSAAVVRRPAKELMEDAVSHLFQWDSRLVHTLKYLFFKPGKLSLDWVQGKRMRYVPPLRLYILSSFILFLLVGIITHGGSDDIPADIQSVDLQSEQVSEELRNALQEANEKGDWLEAAILRGVGKAVEDPSGFLGKIISNLPKAAFVLLPIFGLLHMAVEYRKDRYYIDYLVFSLHFHAFAFLLLTLMLLIGIINQAAGDAAQIMNLCIPVYAVVGIRRFNPQTWLKGLIKGMLIFSAYSIVLVIGVAVFFSLLLVI